MKTYNGYTLSEALQYGKEVPIEDLIELASEVESWRALAYVPWESVEEDPEAVKLVIEDLQKWEEAANDYDTPEELEKYLSSKDQFEQDLRDSFETVHGRIFDTNKEQLAEWIKEDIDNCDKYKTILANIKQAIKDEDTIEYIFSLIPENIL